METINNLVLTDENIYPDMPLLKAVLADSYTQYQKLLDLFHKNDLKETWQFYHDGKAWLCKVQRKSKTIAWMSAWEGFMQATIYVPLRLLDDVLSLEMDNLYKERIVSTKNIGKSKPCIFKIKNEEELKNFEVLMHFKIKAK